MANKLDLVSHSPSWCVTGDAYWFWVKFVSNNALAPDGIDPAINDGLTIAYSATGLFTITFPENKKPLDILWADVTIVGDFDLKGAVDSYNASTGVLTISTHTIAGTPTKVQTNDKEIRVIALCTRSDSGATS